MQGAGWKLAVLHTADQSEFLTQDLTWPIDVRCFNVFVLNCISSNPSHICRLKTYNPNLYKRDKKYSDLMSQPCKLGNEEELLHVPFALGFSHSGEHVAVFAKNFKWRCGGPANTATLVLYTWDKASNSFVRNFGERDQCRVKLGDHQINKGWEIIFSQCGAYISLVYAHNRFKQRQDNATEEGGHAFQHNHKPVSSVHMFHIHPQLGLLHSRPLSNLHFRQICWGHNSLLVMPKHGAILLK